MRFVKIFEGGGATYDPRRNRYAEFECDVCGCIEDVVITNNPGFNTSKPRRCPDCGQMCESDYKNNLRKEIEQLTENVAKIQIEISEKTRKLKELETSTK